MACSALEDVTLGLRDDEATIDAWDTVAYSPLYHAGPDDPLGRFEFARHYRRLQSG